MAVNILFIVHSTQEILRKAAIKSAVTGDLAFSYHGADVATQCIELCVPRSAKELAVQAITAHPDHYSLSQRHMTSEDFYHPYRQSASSFELLTCPSLSLILVTDAALGFDLGQAPVDDGLTLGTAHDELRTLCADMPEVQLKQIAWLSLEVFAPIWVHLAARAKTLELYIVYLSWAEKIFVANEIDREWCEKHLSGDETAVVVQTLLS